MKQEKSINKTFTLKKVSERQETDRENPHQMKLVLNYTDITYLPYSTIARITTSSIYILSPFPWL